MTDIFSVVKAAPAEDCLDGYVRVTTTGDWGRWVPLREDAIHCAIREICVSLDPKGRPEVLLYVTFQDAAERDRHLSRPGEGKAQRW